MAWIWKTREEREGESKIKRGVKEREGGVEGLEEEVENSRSIGKKR